MKTLLQWWIIAACAAALPLSGALAASAPRLARERTYDVLHYRLNLEIDEKAKTCAGTATITLVPLRPELDHVALDAAEMSVSAVTLGGKDAAFAHPGDTLDVALGSAYGLADTLTLQVAYSVHAPRKGLYFMRPDSGYPLKQWQVWSQGEQEDNHYWFPCYDYPNDKATSEMIVTVRDGLVAVSNGLLVSTKRDAAKKKVTYHWREDKPHVSYCISLAVGNYVEVKDAWGTVPISNYVYPHQKGDAMRSFGKTPKMMEYFSRVTKMPYPWEKYGHVVVQDFIYSGQENVSISTLTDGTIHDSRAHLDQTSDGLVAHELAHQWWGDLVSFRDWSHSWLSEGFASYFDFLFEGYDKGNDELDRLIADAQTSVAGADVGDRRRPTVYDRFTNPSELFDNRIYGKGACVLHMLRFTLGDELFWKSIQHYVKKHAYGNVTTEDFRIAIEEATGQNLTWFFDEWLYRAGYPEFSVATAWNQGTRMVDVTVRQTQRQDSLTGIFAMPVDIEVWVHGDPSVYRVTVDSAEQHFSFPAYQEPQLVLFDRGNVLLKKLDQPQPTSAWIFQLEHAALPVDRVRAIEPLGWLADSARVRQALMTALLIDPSWIVRREAAWAISDARTAPGDSIVVAYGDRDARVRAAVVAAMHLATSEEALKTLRHAFEKDSSYAVVATALRSLQEADTARAREYCRQALEKDSHNEAIRTAALNALGMFHDEQSYAEIRSFTRYGVDRNLRVLALTILGRNWKDRGDVLTLMMSMASDPVYHVRRAAVDILGQIGNPLAIPVLEQRAASEAETRLAKAARDAIEKIHKAQK
jgi:aminopeptidase N